MPDKLLDLIGVPEFYATHIGLVESAGNGNIRVVRCIKRGGVLVPVVSVVTPLQCTIISATNVREMALEIFNAEQLHVENATH